MFSVHVVGCLDLSKDCPRVLFDCARAISGDVLLSALCTII